jgi:hypothetical protein
MTSPEERFRPSTLGRIGSYGVGVGFDAERSCWSLSDRLRRVGWKKNSVLHFGLRDTRYAFDERRLRTVSRVRNRGVRLSCFRRRPFEYWRRIPYSCNSIGFRDIRCRSRAAHLQAIVYSASLYPPRRIPWRVTLRTSIFVDFRHIKLARSTCLEVC